MAVDHPTSVRPTALVIGIATALGVGLAAATWTGLLAPAVPRFGAALAGGALPLLAMLPIAMKENPKAILASAVGSLAGLTILVGLDAPTAAAGVVCLHLAVVTGRHALPHPGRWLAAGAMVLATLTGLQLQGIARPAWAGPPIGANLGLLAVYGLLWLAAWTLPDPQAPRPAPPEPPRPARHPAEATPDPDLLEADKLESLGKLAGGIAHDFNNLLTSILGNANLALDDLPDGPTREAVAEIEVASATAKELVAQLLAYAGKGQLQLSALDLSRLVEEMVGLLQRVISPHARLAVDLPDMPMLIEGDPSQVRQIVMNLLTNASDSLGEAPGDVGLSLELQELNRSDLATTLAGEDLPGGSYVCLTVRDTGCGMDPATARRVFEPYFTTKVTGRGLGLAALRGIVRNHRGTLTVHSAPGEGTTFRIWFPWAEEVDADEDLPTDHSRRAPKWTTRVGTVLVAEDEELVRRVSTRMLSKLGFDVITASDGEEALRVFEESGSELDLILLDVQMPKFDGREVLARIAARRPGARVVLMTGFSDSVLTDLPRPPDALLRKPFSLRDLVRALDTALAEPELPAAHDEHPQA